MCIDWYDDYPNILKLVSLILTLPMFTSCCERDFSYLNITKNKIRNRFTNENIDNYARKRKNRGF